MRRRSALGAVLGTVLLLIVIGAVVIGLVATGANTGHQSDQSAALTQIASKQPIAQQYAQSVATAQGKSTVDFATPASTKTMTAVEVVKQVAPAIVTVVNEQAAGPFSGSNQLQPAGIGSGFIISEQGYIVTNWHVVNGGQAFQVIFSNGEQRDATVVGQDQISDLAVVKVDGPVPGVVPLGDSSQLQPGQTVLAIGSPLGQFTNTVTEGIVSALGRSIPEQQGSPELTGLIQHDAAINPGNSGGPLLNLSGEVVGVNTLGIPVTPAGQPAQGLFFAIPSNTVKEIATKLIENGEVIYPFIGIQSAPINEQLASQYNLPVDYGVYVVSVVSGSPADNAGVKQGDIILAINGTKIDAAHSLTELLYKYEPGDTVTLKIQRGNNTQDVQITLGKRPQQ
ncbi:MAG TPA: trypsin-like peptidase domain-containing protein [Thermomicrobiales bacterium]|nr:trypsin-like peptidase domain-containing protein [Thermomicrobiales bacterium]